MSRWWWWLGCLGCGGSDAPEGVPDDAFVGGTLRLSDAIDLPQNCALRLVIPSGREMDPIPLADLPEQGVNMQQPLGEVDAPEAPFWITEDDADFFVDQVDFGWHAWIGCDEGIVLSATSSWGAWGGESTEPFLPPKTDLVIEVDDLD